MAQDQREYKEKEGQMKKLKYPKASAALFVVILFPVVFVLFLGTFLAAVTRVLRRRNADVSRSGI